MDVATLDYLDLYRKHTFIRRESYRLDYINEIELMRIKMKTLTIHLLNFIQKIINSL